MGVYLGTNKISSTGIGFDDIYPVGSIYISISGQYPAIGTWEKLAEGYTLWNTTSGGGGALTGSLPKIEGSAEFGVYAFSSGATVSAGSFSGCLVDGGVTSSKNATKNVETEPVYPQRKLGFSAASSNSAYNASAGTNVVRPTSLAVTMYKRTA